jgi:arsenate reductase
MEGLLLLCTRNTSRSQMAEAFARRLAPAEVHVYSAGACPAEGDAARLDPFAVRAMAEVGFDLSGHRPKGLDEVPLETVDTVITLSAEMRELCPVFPRGVRVLHWTFDDPAAFHLLVDAGMPPSPRPERLRALYRNLREQIRSRLERFIACEMANV